MPTRKEVLAYYRGFEECLRLHAYTCPGEGNLLWVGTPSGRGRTLNNAIKDMKEAKKLALQEAEKPEPDRYAVIEGQPTGSGTITARVRSFSDPEKYYRIAYRPSSNLVHCECESFWRLGTKAGHWPKADEKEFLCKHLKEWLPELQKLAEAST